MAIGTDFICLLLIVASARALDLLSTWLYSPTLDLEANPFVRWLGWRLICYANAVLCVGVALAGAKLVMAVSGLSLIAAAWNTWLWHKYGRR